MRFNLIPSPTLAEHEDSKVPTVLENYMVLLSFGLRHWRNVEQPGVYVCVKDALESGMQRSE